MHAIEPASKIRHIWINKLQRVICSNRQGRDVRPYFKILGGLNHAGMTRLTCQSHDELAGIRGLNLNGLCRHRQKKTCLVRKSALLSKAVICRSGKIICHACDQARNGHVCDIADVDLVGVVIAHDTEVNIVTNDVWVRACIPRQRHTL